MMTILVQKFGGSSLATNEQVVRAASIVRQARDEGTPPVVCVSARGSGTDDLLAEAAALGPADQRELDQLLSTGETASTAFMAMALISQGVPAVSLTGGQAGITVARSGGETRIAGIDPTRIRAHLGAGSVVVVAGFQGVDHAGDTRTLGRGGSDTSAVALAAALGAKVCEIYTDVEGVYSADPRVVPQARVLPEVPSQVMSEMAISGARVVHARAMELAAVHGITVTVGTPASRLPGTVIPARSTDMLENTGFAAAVTHDPHVVRVLVHRPGGASGLGRALMGLLAERFNAIDLVGWPGAAVGGTSAGFVVRAEQAAQLEAALKDTADEFGFTYSLDAGLGQVSLVGTGLLNRPGYTGRVLRVLDTLGVTAEWVSTTQSRVSVLVPTEDVGAVAAAVHEEFGLGRPQAALSPTTGI